MRLPFFRGFFGSFLYIFRLDSMYVFRIPIIQFNFRYFSGDEHLEQQVCYLEVIYNFAEGENKIP